MDYNFESLANDIGRLAGNLSQSEQKKFLKSEAKQFKKAVIRKAQEETTEDTGNYVQGYKVGNPTTHGNEVAVPTINDSPHGHLIEYGHRIVDKSGNESGFVQGKFILTNAALEYKPIFLINAEQWVDRVIDRSGLG